MEKLANSMLPGMLEYQLKHVAKEKASLTQKEGRLEEKFEHYVTQKMINEVFESIIENGHPDQQKKAIQLQEKYNTDHLQVDEILALNDLYRSCGSKPHNKEHDDNG